MRKYWSASGIDSLPSGESQQGARGVRGLIHRPGILRALLFSLPLAAGLFYTAEAAVDKTPDPQAPAQKPMRPKTGRPKLMQKQRPKPKAKLKKG